MCDGAMVVTGIIKMIKTANKTDCKTLLRCIQRLYNLYNQTHQLFSIKYWVLDKIENKFYNMSK
jgi:hypothetical protein